jgi:hypothetical protein
VFHGFHGLCECEGEKLERRRKQKHCGKRNGTATPNTIHAALAKRNLAATFALDFATNFALKFRPACFPDSRPSSRFSKNLTPQKIPPCVSRDRHYSVRGNHD